MKKIGKAAAFIFAVFLFFSPAAALASVQGIPEADASQRVHDYAGILSPDEREKLAGAAGNAVYSVGVDFVILTVEDDLGLGMTRYSDEFYERNGFGGESFDGVMLYINMTERDVYFATYGAVVEMFSQRDIDNLLDDVAPLLSAGRYYEACDRFITLASAHILYIGDSGGYAGDNGIGVAGGLAVSFAAGAAVPLIMLMLHSRSLSPRPGIRAYFSGRGFTLINSRDDFLHTSTTRTPIPQNNSGGSHGGGAHRTSGGHSAGGGGRKF